MGENKKIGKIKEWSNNKDKIVYTFVTL